MIEYSYNIYSLDSYPNYDSYQEVVFRVVYQLVATSGSYSATNTTDQNVEYQPGTPFVPYDSLTKETVVGWIEYALGAQALEDMKKQLKRNIEQQMNPVTLYLPLPFEN